jgi:putative ABC transport system permease protein
MVNEKLAARLNVQVGDGVLVRIRLADPMPSGAPLASDSVSITSLRLTVTHILKDTQFGRFSLQINQIPPASIFISLSQLGDVINQTNGANMILVPQRQGRGVTLKEVNAALKESWQLPDASLQLKVLPNQKTIEVRSSRIFLERPVAEASLRAGHNAKGILTYFVNKIQLNNNATPYSFVSAPGYPLIPTDMRDDEIIINEWLAEDLDATAGDDIALSYYVPVSGHELEELTTRFRIRSVVPITGAASDSWLMPDFPGLHGVDNCRDWDPGIPIDLDMIRKKDQEYWDVRRGTPKAFITINAAQRLWQNRFGNLTAVRYRGGKEVLEDIAESIMNELNPAVLGLQFEPVHLNGVRAGHGAVDFGQLFLGLSLFIIVAAVLLTGLLFTFSIEQRSEETGILLSLGFPPARVRRLLVAEGAVIALIGCIFGTFLGVIYNQVILYGLNTIWAGAVGASTLRLFIAVPTLLVGMVAGVVIAVCVMWLATGQITKKPLTELQQSGGRLEYFTSKRSHLVSLLLALICIPCAAAVLVFSKTGGYGEYPVKFFIAGALLLIGGLALCSVGLLWVEGSQTPGKLGIFGMGIRNCAKRRKRSLTSIGILACGIFIVIAVGANRISITDAQSRASGTGGFFFYGETTIPLLHDLNTNEGKRHYGLEGIDDVEFLQLHLYEGDDASCLNLNSIDQPHILSIRPGELAKRGSFSFVKTLDQNTTENPWLLLNKEIDDNTIPAIADQNVIVWGLKKSVGETLTYVDEGGNEFKLKLVAGLDNSIFQGHVLIAEDVFTQRFPSVSGTRVFLIDVPENRSSEVANTLSRALKNFGIVLNSTFLRLDEFNRVANTYLTIYLFLGGLGLILGSLGLGIMVLRNIMESRSELAILRALGFRKRTIHLTLLVEHVTILSFGIACGTVSAIISVLPNLLSPGMELPVGFIIGMLFGIAVNGSVWTLIATLWATRGNLISALRAE